MQNVRRQSWLWAFSRLGALLLLVVFLKLTEWHPEGTPLTAPRSRILRRVLLQIPSPENEPQTTPLHAFSDHSTAQDLQLETNAGNNSSVSDDEDAPCSGVWEHEGYPDMCSFVKARPSCQSGTFIEYLHLHFCYFKHAQLLSYGVLALWLVILFYTLGNTAADYFCPRYVSRRLG